MNANIYSSEYTANNVLIFGTKVIKIENKLSWKIPWNKEGLKNRTTNFVKSAFQSPKLIRNQVI